MSEEKKVGLKETLEVLAFLEGTLTDLAKSKADDGKIDYMEWAKIAVGNAPEAMKAIRGMDMLDDELKDLDEAEMRILAAGAMQLALSVVGLVKGEDEPEAA